MRLRVIDIETTGGSPSEIIEIAAVDVVSHLGGWKAEPPHARRFKPLGEITFHAMAIHHLTPADLADAPAYSDEGLTAFINEGPAADILVAHHAAFEARHIPVEITGARPWLCTVKAARAAWPEAPGYSNQVLRYWRDLQLAPELAMPAHRAAPDAWVTAHILIDLLKEASVERLMEWNDEARSLEHMPFGKHRGKAWPELPTDYLEWLVVQSEMSDAVRTRASAELTLRKSSDLVAVSSTHF
ncbi:putative quorum-sensing-regulated virulence factor [Brevundimonas diminuta]|uniref:putative quorum-sensing-regulated virulence factor n=1 Tax=Brevundimonas diminuta TaxID=293 RepID=UPI003D04CE36